jgi:hypothetical protein
MTGREGREGPPGEAARSRAQKARLAGFRNHLIGYFAVMTVLVPVNLLSDPETPWFVWPMVGWGPILAGHAAFAMGLFDRNESR